MQILKIALLTILVVMSLAAGAARVMLMPQELTFLAYLGLGETAVMILGIFQCVGGILMIPPKTRRIGAMVAVGALIVSALALFTAGSSSVGLITLFPIAIGVWLISENVGKSSG